MFTQRCSYIAIFCIMPTYVYTLLVHQVKHCETCQRSKRKFDKPAPSLHPIPVSNAWCKVGIDLIELPVSSSGNRYCITLTDYFSKWVEAQPIPTKEAKHVADFLGATKKLSCPPCTPCPPRGAALVSLLLVLCHAGVWSHGREQRCWLHI